VAVVGHPAGELAVAEGVGVPEGAGVPLVLALGSGVGEADGRPLLAEALGRGVEVVREGDADGVAEAVADAGGAVVAVAVAVDDAGVADGVTGATPVTALCW
jgi:hypothetical protein